MDEALRHLGKDAQFKPLIKKFGAPVLRERAGVFEALVRSIIYQQVTGAAAATILGRFRALFPGKKFPTPEEVQKMPFEKMRAAGLSGQKATYIKDLADKCLDGTVEQRRLPHMTSDDIIEHLVQVKGVGVWTAHMFLIFTLGRLDVLPTGDLGIQKGFQILYRTRGLPTPARMESLARANGWRPYASVVSWYLWSLADEAKETKKKTTPQAKRKVKK